MRVNQRTLPNTTRFTTTFAGVGKTDSILLPLDFALQRAIIDLEGTITTTATAPTMVNDAMMALISQIQLQLTGKGGVSTVYNLSGMDIYIKNFFDYRNAMRKITVTAASQNNAPIALVLVIDFRTNKQNEEDFGSVIPLYAYSSAQLQITWVTTATGYASNAAASVSAISITGTVTLIELVPQTSDEVASIAKTTRMLKIYTKPITLDATVAEQLRDRDIDVGNLIRSIYLVAYNATSLARSDSELGYISLGTASVDFIEQLNWTPQQVINKMEYQPLPVYDGNTTMVGVAVLNFAKFPVDPSGNPIGLNTVGLKQGDLKLKLNVLVASPTIRYIHEIYL